MSSAELPDQATDADPRLHRQLYRACCFAHIARMSNQVHRRPGVTSRSRLGESSISRCLSLARMSNLSRPQSQMRRDPPGMQELPESQPGLPVPAKSLFLVHGEQQCGRPIERRYIPHESGYRSASPPCIPRRTAESRGSSRGLDTQLDSPPVHRRVSSF